MNRQVCQKRMTIMKTRRFIMLFFAFVVFLLSQPKEAISEYCWMIGCGGDIGYVFIPSEQIFYTPDSPIQYLNNDKYTRDASNRLFLEYGLPKVNDIVTLNSYAHLLQGNEIEKNKDVILNFGHVYDDETRTVSIMEMLPGTFDAAFPMQPGAKLKILGYHSFLGRVVHMPLFALVIVISDG